MSKKTWVMKRYEKEWVKRPDQEATVVGARRQEAPSHLAKSCDPPLGLIIINVFLIIVYKPNLMVSFEDNTAQSLKSVVCFWQVPDVKC